MDRVYRELYRQLTDDERLKLDTFVLATVEQNADGAAFVERNADRAVRAARRVVRELRDPGDLREERIQALLDFYVPTTANAEPTIENLRLALNVLDIPIDERVRDGLQVSDADPVQIAALSRPITPTTPAENVALAEAPGAIKR